MELETHSYNDKGRIKFKHILYGSHLYDIIHKLCEKLISANKISTCILNDPSLALYGYDIDDGYVKFFTFFDSLTINVNGEIIDNKENNKYISKYPHKVIFNYDDKKTELNLFETSEISEGVENTSLSDNITFIYDFHKYYITSYEYEYGYRSYNGSSFYEDIDELIDAHEKDTIENLQSMVYTDEYIANCETGETIKLTDYTSLWIDGQEIHYDFDAKPYYTKKFYGGYGSNNKNLDALYTLLSLFTSGKFKFTMKKDDDVYKFVTCRQKAIDGIKRCKEMILFFD